MKRGPISHGDLLRAFTAAHATKPAEQAAVAALLGFYSVVAAEGDIEVSAPLKMVKAKSDTRESPAPVAPDETSRPRAALTGQSGFKLEGPRHYEPTIPAWLRKASPLTSPAPVRGKSAEPPSLFDPRWNKNILATMLSTLQIDGRLDIVRLVVAIATRTWPTVLPRLARYAPRGVQVLVDVAEGMAPFAADQRQVLQTLSRLLGADRVTRLEVLGSPLDRVSSSPDEDWHPYGEAQLPPPGTPVLALTDLGIGRPPVSRRGTTSEWRRFADRLSSRGSPVIALIPYAERRCPPQLKRVMRVVAWDRLTTVGTVRFRRTGTDT